MTHVCNPNTQEAQVGGFGFKSSLGTTIWPFKPIFSLVRSFSLVHKEIILYILEITVLAAASKFPHIASNHIRAKLQLLLVGYSKFSFFALLEKPLEKNAFIWFLIYHGVAHEGPGIPTLPSGFPLAAMHHPLSSLPCLVSLAGLIFLCKSHILAFSLPSTLSYKRAGLGCKQGVSLRMT